MIDKLEIGLDEEGNIVESQFLLKVTKMEYIEDIQNGKLYMNTLGYFRALAQEGMGDDQEGLIGYCKDGNLLWNDKVVAEIRSASIHLSNYPIFCLLSIKLKVDNESRLVYEVPTRFLKEFMFEENEEYGMVIIRKDKFIARIKEVLKKKGINAIYGDVKYTDDIRFISREEAYKAAFRKRTSFEHQNEWRLFVDKVTEEPFILELGDIREFSWQYPIEDSCEEIKVGIDFYDKNEG